MQIGDIIQLKTNGCPGFGGLNYYMLLEEKYFSTKPTIVHNLQPLQVKLPSGYILNIKESDIRI